MDVAVAAAAVAVQARALANASAQDHHRHHHLLQLKRVLLYVAKSVDAVLAAGNVKQLHHHQAPLHLQDRPQLARDQDRPLRHRAPQLRAQQPPQRPQRQQLQQHQRPQQQQPQQQRQQPQQLAVHKNFERSKAEAIETIGSPNEFSPWQNDHRCITFTIIYC